jgi:hypothetical protein
MLRTRWGVIDSTTSVLSWVSCTAAEQAADDRQVAQARHLGAAAALVVLDQARQHLVLAILQLQHGGGRAGADAVGGGAALGLDGVDQGC